jgi:hypothetical protein
LTGITTPSFKIKSNLFYLEEKIHGKKAFFDVEFSSDVDAGGLRWRATASRGAGSGGAGCGAD